MIAIGCGKVASAVPGISVQCDRNAASGGTVASNAVGTNAARARSRGRASHRIAPAIAIHKPSYQ